MLRRSHALSFISIVSLRWHFWHCRKLIRSSSCAESEGENEGKPDEVQDPLPNKLQQTFVSVTLDRRTRPYLQWRCNVIYFLFQVTRIHNDLIICTITAVFVFGVHVSKVFTELNVRTSRSINTLKLKLYHSVYQQWEKSIGKSKLLFMFIFQPYVGYIFSCFAGVLGLIAHYLIPQLRKALPWLCCANPVLKSREYYLYEVKGTCMVLTFI